MTFQGFRIGVIHSSRDLNVKGLEGLKRILKKKKRRKIIAMTGGHHFFIPDVESVSVYSEFGSFLLTKVMRSDPALFL